jgi:hypothetical protein
VAVHVRKSRAGTVRDDNTWLSERGGIPGITGMAMAMARLCTGSTQAMKADSRPDKACSRGIVCGEQIKAFGITLGLFPLL